MTPLDPRLPRDPLIYVKLRKPWRWEVCRALPYGFWTEHDGGVVFFDRQYEPLCRRHPDGRIELVGPEVWIYWHRQDWLYQKHNPDWSRATRSRLNKLVAELGIADVVMARAVVVANRLQHPTARRPMPWQCYRPLPPRE